MFSSHTVRSRRAGPRRRALVVAIVAAVTGVTSMVGVRPAGAVTDIERYSLIENARLAAQVALSRKSCQEELAGPAGPSRLFPSLEVPRILASASIVYQPVPPPGVGPNDAASAPFAAGANQTIGVHDPFFDDSGVFSLNFLGPLSPSVDISDRNVQRIVTILHEVGHLTGRQPLDRDFGDEEARYNTAVANACLAPQFGVSQLEISFLQCEQTFTTSTSYALFSEITCRAGWENGVGPFQVRWNPPGSVFRIDVHQEARQSTLVTSCPSAVPDGFGNFIHPTAVITFSVTDATGATASAATRIQCFHFGPVW